MTNQQSVLAWTSSTKLITAGLVAALAIIAYFTGISGLVSADPSQVFRPVGIAVIVPVALFFTAYRYSSRLRNFVLAQDLRTLTMLHHWRVLGFTFLILYAHDIFPAAFAWPAGFGDILVGFTAPFVVSRLARDPAFATSWRFIAYHALGLFDFVVAVMAATLTSGAFPGLFASPLTSGAMEVWPLNLFPSFFVPLFIITHIIVFLKVRELRREARAGADTALQAV
ncbi:MAG: hypothetical protein GKS02_09900 [Alphaproteobacteria bacterium]|nr:hypothetical protein [Alphaproteobacteria bacterium]